MPAWHSTTDKSKADISPHPFTRTIGARGKRGERPSITASQARAMAHGWKGLHYICQGQQGKISARARLLALFPDPMVMVPKECAGKPS